MNRAADRILLEAKGLSASYGRAQVLFGVHIALRAGEVVALMGRNGAGKSTFGLSMAFDFDVYLIDEVTAAGDQRFREKSKRLLMQRRQNADLLMVDHNLWGLKLHCDRAFILEGGKIEIFDDLEEAVALHTERLLAAPAQRGVEEQPS